MCVLYFPNSSFHSPIELYQCINLRSHYADTDSCPFLFLPLFSPFPIFVFFFFSLPFFHIGSLSLWLPLFSSYSRSTRTLSLWPPSGPSPPSTPSATPSIRTELPRSSLPQCHAPSRPCPGSSALSTINETPGNQPPPSSSRPPPPPHTHLFLLLSPPLSDPASRREELGRPSTASPLLWNFVFGSGDRHVEN